MNVLKHYTFLKHLQGSKRSVTNDFFQTKIFLKALSYQLKMFKSILNRSFAFAKKLLHRESLGYQYEHQKLLKEKRRTYAHEPA
jgi:hypothetical protein